jgi:NAD(P)-dependent dehydrogenase (short-subunit alcohol dehydrogenase family)
MGWSVILGASEGTGAAIARAVARDPGLEVLAVHRGRHPAAAAALEEEIRGLGRKTAFRVFDAGTAEAAAAGADEILCAAGPRSVDLFVHALSGASLGLFTGQGEKNLSARQIQRTFDALAHSFVFWIQELDRRDLLAPGARLLGLTNPLGKSLILPCGLIAAAKAALETYVRCLALEMGPRGYRVKIGRAHV